MFFLEHRGISFGVLGSALLTARCLTSHLNFIFLKIRAKLVEVKHQKRYNPTCHCARSTNFLNLSFENQVAILMQLELTWMGNKCHKKRNVLILAGIVFVFSFPVCVITYIASIPSLAWSLKQISWPSDEVCIGLRGLGYPTH